ncbi:hypothetical protein ABZP36_032914 [Zizania latifolia]
MVVGKSRGDTAINTVVNLVEEEANLAREGVKGPGHPVLSICKSLAAGGIAGGVSRTAVASLEQLKILLQKITGKSNTEQKQRSVNLKYVKLGFLSSGFPETSSWAVFAVVVPLVSALLAGPP